LGQEKESLPRLFETCGSPSEFPLIGSKRIGHKYDPIAYFWLSIFFDFIYLNKNLAFCQNFDTSL
jgi:hypothetical protein